MLNNAKSSDNFRCQKMRRFFFFEYHKTNKERVIITNGINGTIDGESIEKVRQSVEAYEKRNSFFRFFQRLFTRIREKQLLLCFYNELLEEKKNMLPHQETKPAETKETAKNLPSPRAQPMVKIAHDSKNNTSSEETGWGAKIFRTGSGWLESVANFLSSKVASSSQQPKAATHSISSTSSSYSSPESMSSTQSLLLTNHEKIAWHALLAMYRPHIPAGQRDATSSSEISWENVRKIYIALSLQCHPDKSDKAGKEKAEEQFRDLTGYYQRLYVANRDQENRRAAQVGGLYDPDRIDLANERCSSFGNAATEDELNQAWDVYESEFVNIYRQLDELEVQLNALEAINDALEARTDALEARNDELKAESDAFMVILEKRVLQVEFKREESSLAAENNTELSASKASSRTVDLPATSITPPQVSHGLFAPMGSLEAKKDTIAPGTIDTHPSPPKS